MLTRVGHSLRVIRHCRVLDGRHGAGGCASVLAVAKGAERHAVVREMNKGGLNRISSRLWWVQINQLELPEIHGAGIPAGRVKECCRAKPRSRPRGPAANERPRSADYAGQSFKADGAIDPPSLCAHAGTPTASGIARRSAP